MALRVGNTSGSELGNTFGPELRNTFGPTLGNTYGPGWGILLAFDIQYFWLLFHQKGLFRYRSIVQILAN
jgi:hypothetical protein